MSYLWGIDLGGTKIEGVILPSDKLSNPLVRTRVPTEADQGYDHVLNQIQELVAEMAKSAPMPKVIGIGMPGTEDPSTGNLKNSNTVCLNGKPVSRDLAARLGCEIRIANDANCFALAESLMGAAKGCGVVFGVILGTGVGGGIVVDGKVLGGLHGIAGEWGHNELEPNGQPCYCGKIGCVETVLSGPFLERFYESQSGEKKRLVDIASSGDPAAVATINRLCAGFGKAMSVVINILDPDAIVLGGGVGNIGALYTRGRKELTKWVFNPEVRTQILKPALGDSAGVFGAALLGS